MREAESTSDCMARLEGAEEGQTVPCEQGKQRQSVQRTSPAVEVGL